MTEQHQISEEAKAFFKEYEIDANATEVNLALHLKDLKDSDIAYLAEMPNLQSLDLSFTSLTDAIAPSLAKLDKLETLDLSGTEVTDAIAPSLEKLTNLQTLALPDVIAIDKIDEPFGEILSMDAGHLQKESISDAVRARLEQHCEANAARIEANNADHMVHENANPSLKPNQFQIVTGLPKGTQVVGK